MSVHAANYYDTVVTLVPVVCLICILEAWGLQAIMPLGYVSGRPRVLVLCQQRDQTQGTPLSWLSKPWQ